MEAKEELNKKPKDEDSDALEKVLFHIGEMGRYQKLLFLAMLPFGFAFAFIYFVQMFIAATPQNHWCKVPELEHLDPVVRRNLSVPLRADCSSDTEWCWEKCVTYKANWSRILETMVPPDPGTPTIACQDGWEYALGDIPYHTVVSERGWVCDSSGYAPLAQSIFFGGSFLGGLIFGWLADRFGRIPALVGANLIGAVGGIASIFTTGLWDFIFCRFLVGMAYDSAFMMIYILVLEYVGPSHRTWVGNMSIALYFGSGCLVLPWLAVWIADWRRLLLVTSIPMFIVLAAPFLVPESARWLSSRGKVNKAVEVLKRIEKINGATVPQDVMDDFIVSARQTRRTNESMLSLLKSAPLRNAMLFMIFVYMSCAIVFDGLVRMSENLGFDFFITFTLTSATEIPSVTLLALVLDRWGRRKLTCGPLLLSGLLTLVAAFLPKGIAQVSLAIMARFFINMAYNTSIQWATELLPTPVRASGSSAVHVSGYIATVLSPIVVYMERVWSPLPLLILAVASLSAGLVSALLPETMGRPMPQTLAEGEKLVRDYTICGKPEEAEELEWR